MLPHQEDIVKKYMGDDFYQGRPKHVPDDVLVNMWDEIIQVMDPVSEKEEQSVLSFMGTFRKGTVRSCDLAAWGPIRDLVRAIKSNRPKLQGDKSKNTRLFE